MSLSLISLCLALVADEPMAPEKAAAIEHAQVKAQAEVDAKYGNKKATELSPDERKQRAKDLAAADKAVLDKNGVDPKQWARESLRKDRDQYAQGKQLRKDLEEKEKAADAKAKAEANAPKEIVVQRGVSEENPVTLDEKANADGQIPVEKGLPPEALQEQAELSSMEGGGAPPSIPEAAKPAAKAGKGSRHR
jgi:hypothetical protein